MAWVWPQGIGLREHDCSRHSPDRERVARPQACPPPPLAPSLGQQGSPHKCRAGRGLGNKKWLVATVMGAGGSGEREEGGLPPWVTCGSKCREGGMGAGHPPLSYGWKHLAQQYFKLGRQLPLGQSSWQSLSNCSKMKCNKMRWETFPAPLPIPSLLPPAAAAVPPSTRRTFVIKCSLVRQLLLSCLSWCLSSSPCSCSFLSPPSPSSAPFHSSTSLFICGYCGSGWIAVLMCWQHFNQLEISWRALLPLPLPSLSLFQLPCWSGWPAGQPVADQEPSRSAAFALRSQLLPRN